MEVEEENIVWEDLLSFLPVEIAVSCLRSLPMRAIGRLNVSSKKSYEGGLAWQLAERIILTRETCHHSPSQLYNILSSHELVNARYLEIDTSTPSDALEAILPQLSSTSLNLITTLLIDTEPMSASSWYQSNMFQPSCLPSIAPRLRSWWLRIEHDALLRNSELDLSTQGIVESRLETCLQNLTEKLENLEELRLPALFTRHLMPKPTKKNSIASFVPKLPSLRRLVTMGRPPVEVVHRGDTDPDGVEHIFFCGDGLFESESVGDHRVALNSYWDFPAIIDGSLSACPRPCTLLHMFVGLSRCLAKNLHSFLDNSGAEFEVNERLDHGPIALHVAIKRKHKDAVSILLEAGSDVTLRDISCGALTHRPPSGHNALTLAVHCSTQPIVEMLFKHAESKGLFSADRSEEGNGRGTPMILRDIRGGTVLNLAAARTDADGSDVLKWLLDPMQIDRFNLHVDDSSADKWLAPIHSVRTSEAARALAAAGANLMAQTIDGDTPITHFIQNNFSGMTTEDTAFGIAQTLRVLGASLPQSGSIDLFRALNSACNISSTSWLEMLLSVADPVQDLSRVEIVTNPPHGAIAAPPTLLYRCIKNSHHNHLVLLLAAGADATTRINGLTYIDACLMQPSLGPPTRLMKMIVMFANHGCPVEVTNPLPSSTKTPKLSMLAADFLSKADADAIAEELSCLQSFVNLIIPSEGAAGTFALAMAVISRMRSTYALDLVGELIFNSAPGFFGVATLLGEAISRGNIQVFEWLLANKPREENFCPFGPNPFLCVLQADDGVRDEQRHFMARCLADAGCVFDPALVMNELVAEKAEQFPLTLGLFTQLSQSYDHDRVAAKTASLVAAATPAGTLGCIPLGSMDDVSRDEETSIVISVDEASETSRFGHGPFGAENGPRRSARLEAKNTSKPPVVPKQDIPEPGAKRAKRH
eukprot:TRINITY_DN2607_c0_g1_i1.p1 TRINITY_DN2607_c0_g1~~TRINITY_DN2607_c0_g1_i1.p1  ORF type:complete len:932 (+),score=152.20 TRINITY_DN2607_c0_g1_i1:200-2995(+)